ncbi:MAG TPA: OmpH family outer membrane protein [Bacteroidales bacterium]|nr:OmpH family outer membrane protein [Bacteroidales bacterium]
MIKKIALLLLAVLPMGLMAQNQKIGHVNSQEIFALMPEVETIQKQLNDIGTEWEEILDKMQQELTAQIKDFQDKQATMSESIKQARMAELQDREQRIANTRQQAQLDVMKKQEELLAPIREKITKAISDVATENNYAYIFDMASQTIVHTGAAANDITPLVKKKLNLTDKKPATPAPAK